MPIKDIEEKRRYNRRWMSKRRKAWVEENGPCKKCGSFDNLEVDHIDPKTKNFNPSSLWSRAEKIRIQELKKCQVLCHKCHKIKTLKEQYRAPCGTSSRYDAGCRCDECRKAAVKKVNEFRWRTGRRHRRFIPSMIQ